MTFAKKIFIAVFVSTAVVGTVLIWSGYQYTVSRSKDEFVSRYEIFTKTLGNTLTRLDSSTESLMLNAAKVLVEKDEKHGLLSIDQLYQLQPELGVTHLFVIDKSGKFLRSTNDDTERIPNLYSFCDGYRKLVSGESKVEATPIITPNPEPKPYKFLLVPNSDKSRIIEVGVRVDFIAKTLTEASKSDKNISSMSLYAPDGSPFGTFSAKEVVFDEKKVNLPQSLSKSLVENDHVRFFTKVTSSHPRCCQCDVAGTSKDGEYYYVLENRVSTTELKALLAKASALFMLVCIGNCIFAWIVARLLSRRLVRHIETAVDRVRKIKEQGNVKDRIGLNSGDEISFLTQEFDHLLDSFEETQGKLIEAEKIHSKVELAKIVAHNIKSPALAIEMMIPGLITVPERMKSVLRNAVVEIKQLTEKLKTQADTITVDLKRELETDLLFLPIFLEDLASQKSVEFSAKKKGTVCFLFDGKDEGVFVKASLIELKSVLSNIINNAAESYGNGCGEILLNLQSSNKSCIITITDYGAGIPSEYLRELGTRNLTFKGDPCRGVGLVHAFKYIHSIGGKIEIRSTFKVGTVVEILLPHYRSDTPAEYESKGLAAT